MGLARVARLGRCGPRHISGSDAGQAAICGYKCGRFIDTSGLASRRGWDRLDELVAFLSLRLVEDEELAHELVGSTVLSPTEYALAVSWAQHLMSRLVANRAIMTQCTPFVADHPRLADLKCRVLIELAAQYSAHADFNDAWRS